MPSDPLSDDLIQELATKSAILDETSDFVGTVDAQGNLLYINRAGLFMLAREADASKGLRLADCLPQWAQTVVLQVGFPTAARKGNWSGESALLTRDGREIPVSQAIVAHKSPAGEVAYFSTIMRDISDRIDMESRLTRSRDFYLKLFHDFPNPIWRSGADAKCDYFNQAWLAFTGRSLLQESGDGWAQGVHPDDLAHCLDAYREAFAARRAFEMEYRLRRHDGEYRWVVDCGSPFFDMEGEFAGYIGSCYDITARKHNEEQLEFQATHDALTGLPNRNLLDDRLQQAVLVAKREQRAVAVLFLDLDQFRFVNDSLGHGVGDRLLAEVAQRLRGAVRQGDTVAHQGGDEFVIVLADVAIEDDAAEVVQKLLACLHPPFQVDEHEIFVTASIGVSLYPGDGEDIHTLLRNADMAMYRAKDEGRNNFQFFAADMNARVFERLSLEGNLRHALEREEFLLYYQPQVDLVSGQMIGVEALLRWRHPELGLVPPVKFIPLAEETGLIVAIGAWVLKKACAQNKAWQDAGLPHLTMAVNLSALQFRRQDLVAGVRQVLAETGLAPRHLELELTESMIMRDPEQVIGVLRQLADMGVQLSVDDFGTGYSSLSYLKRFPIDKVKIDQSFVRDITTDPDDAAIAKTIVSIAHDMRLKVIAEGAETEGQVSMLRGYGCDEMQGYLFSRPLPPQELEALLREGRRLPVKVAAEGGERTLLLVDDEANVLNALMRLLRRDGYRILRAESGLAALDLLATNEVGVIVSDQRMPAMNGVEFLRRAKQIHPDTVRMVLSGYTELKSVTDAINEGAVYKFLTKPWDDELLRENIREAFQRYELRTENARLAQNLAAANESLARAKGELEVEVEHSVGVLRVSQEMLELLPVGAVGIDRDGIVVAANRKADEILAGGQALLGTPAAECLPAAMAGCVERVLQDGAAEGGSWQAPPHGDFEFQCHVMGATSRSQGALLTIIPMGRRA